jgi:hypothetical protein
MTAHQILERIRKAGGEVRLGPEGRLQCRRVPPRLEQLLSRNYYRVQTWLAEGLASRAWEASGKDPGWHKNYKSPLLPITVNVPCTCSAFGFPHYHEPGSQPTYKCKAGEDAFDVLRRIIKVATQEVQ